MLSIYCIILQSKLKNVDKWIQVHSVQKEEPCILNPPPPKKINKQNQTPLNKTKESKKKKSQQQQKF